MRYLFINTSILMPPRSTSSDDGGEEDEDEDEQLEPVSRQADRAADKKKADYAIAEDNAAAEAVLSETPTAAAADAMQESPGKAATPVIVTPARTSVVDKLEKARVGGEEEKGDERKEKRRRKRRKKRRSPRKIKNFEDDYENEEELERFKLTGIRTKTHTLELTRLMVRATDLNTRMVLAGLLREADSPCRRLFLDYHGLKILGGWMAELGWAEAKVIYDLDPER